MFRGSSMTVLSDSFIFGSLPTTEPYRHEHRCDNTPLNPGTKSWHAHIFFLYGSLKSLDL